VLDYPISDFVWRGLRDALLKMAELQFAAGAKQVLPLHKDAPLVNSFADAKAVINALPMQALRMQVVSAHVMGGCAMGENAEHCVSDSWGRLRGYRNISIHDGSLFPTSLGVNPQLTIYGLIWRLAERLSVDLKKTI
jgi:choline dehydrogenase-like flavoprotein